MQPYNPEIKTAGLVVAALRGRIQTFHGPDQFSAINKQTVTGAVSITTTGVDSDQQADLRVHGGQDKAVHHYAQEHYVYWRQALGEVAAQVLAAPGAFGENIASTGLTEADVCIGDQVQIGSCILEVSQSRQPCWKLNLRFSTPDMSLRVQETGKTGWYYRVLQNGYIQAGDAIGLLCRPYPQWNLMRVNRLLFASVVESEELREFARLPLTPSWRKLVERRLASGEIEDMRKRLYKL